MAVNVVVVVLRSVFTFPPVFSTPTFLPAVACFFVVSHVLFPRMNFHDSRGSCTTISATDRRFTAYPVSTSVKVNVSTE